MKKNIIFLLKLRSLYLKYYINNTYYEFINYNIIKNKIFYLNIPNYFDNESILIFKYLKKNLNYNKIYILKSIDKYNINLLVKKYKTENEINKILEFNYSKSEEYHNKNLMSFILFSYKFDEETYFIFSYIIGSHLTKYNEQNEIQQELVSYYYDDINYDNIWFTTDIIKYIKINNEFKITKYYPFYINL